jgi:hypothetical protein
VTYLKARWPFILAFLGSLSLFLVSKVEARPTDKGAGYAQAGAPSDGDVMAIASVGPSAVYIADADTGALCFAWGELITLKAQGGSVIAAPVMVPSASGELTWTAALGTNGACRVTDSQGPDGRAACAHIAPSERVDIVPLFDRVYQRPGARAGICSTAIISANGRRVRPPCRVTADCTGLGAGTCQTGDAAVSALRTEGCAFIMVQVSTNPTTLHWRIEQ